MRHVIATRFIALIIAVGLLMIAAGSTVIFAFSTQILVPAQPGTPIYHDNVNGRMVWRPGQPSQPEHFETSYPNFSPGLVLIFVGLAISAAGLLFHKREARSETVDNERSLRTDLSDQNGRVIPRFFSRVLIMINLIRCTLDRVSVAC